MNDREFDEEFRKIVEETGPLEWPDPSAFSRDRECYQMRAKGCAWPTIVDRLGYDSTMHAKYRCLMFMKSLGVK